MSKKLTIIISDSTYEQLLSLKSTLDLSTLSGTAALSIEMLKWIMSKQKEGFSVKAEKKFPNEAIIHECPINLKSKNL